MDSMVAKFLKENEITQCPDEQIFTSDRDRLVSKSHKGRNQDAKPDPMWDELEVFDNELKAKVTFNMRTYRSGVKVNKQTEMSCTYMYSRHVTGQSSTGCKIREDTITKRISSGRYKVTKKAKGS